MVTVNDLRQKNEHEITAFLAEARVKLHELALKAALKQLKNVRELRSLKRNIARCLTVLRERRQK